MKKYILFIDIEQAISQYFQSWIICLMQKKYSMLSNASEMGG